MATHSGHYIAVDVSELADLSDSYVMTDFIDVIQFRQPGFHKTDLTLGQTAPEDRFFLQAFVENLENKLVLNVPLARFHMNYS